MNSLRLRKFEAEAILFIILMGKKVKKEEPKPKPKTLKLSKKIMKENHRQILQMKLPADIHDVKNKHRRIHLADVKRLQ